MTQETILGSIYTKLSAIANIPKVMYPNIKYDTIPSEYVKVYVIPATTQSYSFDYAVDKFGIIQIDCTTLLNLGDIKVAQIAQKIADGFKNRSVISGELKVSGAVSIGNTRIDGDRYITSVTIPYRVVDSE